MPQLQIYSPYRRHVDTMLTCLIERESGGTEREQQRFCSSIPEEDRWRTLETRREKGAVVKSTRNDCACSQPQMTLITYYGVLVI